MLARCPRAVHPGGHHGCGVVLPVGDVLRPRVGLPRPLPPGRTGRGRRGWRGRSSRGRACRRCAPGRPPASPSSCDQRGAPGAGPRTVDEREHLALEPRWRARRWRRTAAGAAGAGAALLAGGWVVVSGAAAEVSVVAGRAAASVGAGASGSGSRWSREPGRGRGDRRRRRRWDAVAAHHDRRGRPRRTGRQPTTDDESSAMRRRRPIPRTRRAPRGRSRSPAVLRVTPRAMRPPRRRAERRLRCGTTAERAGEPGGERGSRQGDGARNNLTGEISNCYRTGLTVRAASRSVKGCRHKFTSAWSRPQWLDRLQWPAPTRHHEPVRDRPDGPVTRSASYPEEHAAGERRLAQHRHGRRLRPDRRRLLRRARSPWSPSASPRSAAMAESGGRRGKAVQRLLERPQPLPGRRPGRRHAGRVLLGRVRRQHAVRGRWPSWLEGRGLSAGLSGTLALVLVTIAISYLSLVVGELTPKRLALQRAEGFSLIVAAPLEHDRDALPAGHLAALEVDRRARAAPRRRPEGQRRVDQPGGAPRPGGGARVAQQRRAAAHRRGLPRRRARGPRGHDAAHRGRLPRRVA